MWRIVEGGFIWTQWPFKSSLSTWCTFSKCCLSVVRFLNARLALQPSHWQTRRCSSERSEKAGYLARSIEAQGDIDGRYNARAGAEFEFEPSTLRCPPAGGLPDAYQPLSGAYQRSTHSYRDPARLAPIIIATTQAAEFSLLGPYQSRHIATRIRPAAHPSRTGPCQRCIQFLHG